MYVTISDFIKEWQNEARLTQNILDALTDPSLGQQVYDDGRTLGRIAYHFTTNIPEYLAAFGLEIEPVENTDTVPSLAKEIAETFRVLSERAVTAIESQWTDESLAQYQTAFGRQESNAAIFMGLIKHIIHHRGQLTVLMRQAGLKPTAVYGPPKEDWAKFGVEPPL